MFHLLLQVLDEGMLTDSTGRKVDFSNTILIMTSNVGADSRVSHKVLGFSSDSDTAQAQRDEENITKELKETFKPEFLNRIDDVVFFRSLSIEDIREIANRMLSDVVRRAAALGIKLTPDAKLSEFFAQKSFKKEYGARPLRRMIVKKLEDSLSFQLLEQNILPGDSVRAYADPESEEIMFSKI